MENLDTGLETADPCSGQQATSPPAIVPILDSLTTSRSEKTRVLEIYCAPNFVLTTIEKGYKLLFASLPLAVRLKKKARHHADFVDQAVLELVNSGRVFKQPFLVNPLSVSIQPCGKMR